MSINPSREQFEAFKNRDRSEPIYMLNQIRFRKIAEYPKSHENHRRNMSGKEAYKLYGASTSALLEKVGAKQFFVGSKPLVVTGPKELFWDAVFIVFYPSTNAFLQFIKDPFYANSCVVHRTAAVSDSRLIRLGKIESKL